MADVDSKVCRDSHGLKLLPCVFFSDVLCAFRKDSRLMLLSRCFSCREYSRFMCEMDEEDARMTAEIEEIEANPEAYLRGDLS